MKQEWKVMAERERRSLANTAEVMIRDYCGRNGMTIPEQSELFSRQHNELQAHER